MQGLQLPLFCNYHYLKGGVDMNVSYNAGLVGVKVKQENECVGEKIRNGRIVGKFFKCGETGHYKKDCPKANVNRVENRESESDTEGCMYVNAKKWQVPEMLDIFWCRDDYHTRVMCSRLGWQWSS